MAWKQGSQYETRQPARANAKRLRRSLTDAEKVLWRHLRGDFAGSGTHFRRQVAIGPYVADFCCLAHRVVVELDGPVHSTESARLHDRNRDDWLRQQGFVVLRFQNDEAPLRRHQVLQTIGAALAAATPTPSPSPQGGGEPRGIAS